MHYPLIMISLPAAKVLFFIALTLGPSNPHKILVTSNSETYVWSHSKEGWMFDAKGFPASDFTRESDQCFAVSPTSSDDIKDSLKIIAKHDWSHDSVMIFENGDRVEKNDDTGFYIVNAGGANQKVYTILYDDAVTERK